MRTFELKPHQKQILIEVKNLPKSKLHYLVIQQNRNKPNFTLKELKKHIKTGIKKYVSQLYPFNTIKNLEEKIIKYYCFFETSKEFNYSQNKNNIVDENIEMNLHLHLFITSSDSNVYVPKLINDIIQEYFNQTNKQSSLLKIDYYKIEKLEDDFILYHTKQMKDFINIDFIMKNI
jgi:hypothetical protein